jgi:hypothetical protein
MNVLLETGIIIGTVVDKQNIEALIEQICEGTTWYSSKSWEISNKGKSGKYTCHQ